MSSIKKIKDVLERARSEWDETLKNHGDSGYVPSFIETIDDVLSTVKDLEEEEKTVDNGNMTEFEKQVSAIIDSVLKGEYPYNEKTVKWFSQALLGYARHELDQRDGMTDRYGIKFIAGCIDDALKEKSEKPIIQEERELTDFESALFSAFSDMWQSYMRGEEVNVAEHVKAVAPQLQKVAQVQSDVRKCIDYPTELRESEDERIRKDIRVVIESYATRCLKETGKMPECYDRIVAYLERQKDKPVCDGLEEEVDRYTLDYLEGDDVGKPYVLHCARHFAQWQYQKDRGEFAKIKAKTWCEGFDAHKEKTKKEYEEWCPPGGAFKFNLNSALYNFGKEVASKCLDTHILDASLDEYVTEDNVNEYVERYAKCIAKGVIQEMMKDAVSATALTSYPTDPGNDIFRFDKKRKMMGKFKAGDKVKLFILPKED